MTTFATNRKAHFNYEVLEKIEAGIELLGFEVKSVKAGKVTLDGSHVTIRGQEAYLIGVTISPFQPNNTPKEYDTSRNRRLLLTKKELLALEQSEAHKGLTIVPISMYSKNRKIKVEIAIVRGKKIFDKRDSIKKRDGKREIERTLKSR
ncbi:MAG: SsrA-binding protein SmpB [bacterium]